MRKSIKCVFTSAGFFSQLGNNGIFCNRKISAYVSDAAAVESLYFDLLFNSRLPSIIRVVMLKALSAFIAAIPMCSVFAATVLDQVVSSAVPTSDFDILFHNDSTINDSTIYRRKFYRSTDLARHPRE